jgi:hypothetical protein
MFGLFSKFIFSSLVGFGLQSYALGAGFQQECTTTSHHVKIIENPRTLGLEYYAWRLDPVTGAAQTKEPSLVLKNGSPAGGGGNYSLYFRNGSYVYTLQVRSVVEEGLLRYLQVYNGTKVVLAELCL